MPGWTWQATVQNADVEEKKLEGIERGGESGEKSGRSEGEEKA